MRIEKRLPQRRKGAKETKIIEGVVNGAETAQHCMAEKSVNRPCLPEDVIFLRRNYLCRIKDDLRVLCAPRVSAADFYRKGCTA